MFTFLFFLGVSLILLIEGRMLLMAFAGRSLREPLLSALGFPMGAFLNALLFFLFTILSIPLTTPILFISHVVLLAILSFFLLPFLRKGAFPSEPSSPPPLRDDLFQHILPSPTRKFLLGILILSLSIKALFGVSHALILPTFYYDSLSQWNMRAEVSYEDNAIAFDPTEARGISKPQYPILLHSLQILFMLPQGEWKDSVANSATLLLTVSSFLALFLFLRERDGTLFGLLAFSPFLLLPLATLHLVQGYGDLHVITYLLLSACFFLAFTERKKRELLLVSALFVAASAWVKQEGLFFGLLPWLMIVTTWYLISSPSKRKDDLLFGYLPAISLGSLWTLYLLFRGLPFSAHSGDFLFRYYPEALVPLLQAFFSLGSFGISFFVLPILLLVILLSLREWKSLLAPLLILSWGAIAFMETIVVYVFTPNVEFLLNGQTFHRTMLISLFLLIFGMIFTTEKILLRKFR